MKVTLTRLDDAFHFEARGEGGVSMQFDAGPDIGGHGLDELLSASDEASRSLAPEWYADAA